jgi:hypothetical protein
VIGDEDRFPRGGQSDVLAQSILKDLEAHSSQTVKVAPSSYFVKGPPPGAARVAP